jgi:hypothetical protein
LGLILSLRGLTQKGEGTNLGAGSPWQTGKYPTPPPPKLDLEGKKKEGNFSQMEKKREYFVMYSFFLG